MNKAEARRLIDMAEIYSRTDGPEAYYWQGYKQGVRRALHGEGFDQRKHEILMAVGDDEFDDARRLQARGYRAGLAGHEPEQGLPDV